MTLWRVVLSEPQLATYAQLCDGTYDINDLYDMHEALDLLQEMNKADDN